MTPEEIEKLQEGEELDFNISKYVFRNSDEDIDNANDLIIPKYSTCRAATARVVVHLMSSPKFTDEIQREWDRQKEFLKKDGIRPNNILFLIWATPDIICRAALRSIVLKG